MVSGQEKARNYFMGETQELKQQHKVLWDNIQRCMFVCEVIIEQNLVLLEKLDLPADLEFYTQRVQEKLQEAEKKQREMAAQQSAVKHGKLTKEDLERMVEEARAKKKADLEAGEDVVDSEVVEITAEEIKAEQDKKSEE